MAIRKDIEIKMRNGFYSDAKGYVFRSVQKYSREHKGARPEKTYIGKLSEKKGFFHPNDRYFEMYPQEEKKEELPKQSPSISYGPFALFEKIAADTGLRECLIRSFLPGEETDTQKASEETIGNADLVLDLASYMIRDESGDMQHFPEYCFRNAILSDRIASDSEVSKFLKESIDNRTREKFLSVWRESNRSDEPVFVCYDSTNFNSVSEGVSFVERGYAKDDPDKPQFNLECVVRSKDGLPLAYDTFPGSVIDIRQCRKMIGLIKNLGYKDITFVCDRGYISEENIRQIREEGYSFVFMVKDNLVMKKDIVDEHGQDIRENFDCYYKDYDVFAKTYRVTIYDDMEVYHHLFYTSEISKEDRLFFHDRIDRMEEELRGMIGKKIEQPKSQMEKTYGRYFDLVFPDSQGSKLVLASFSRNIGKINSEYRKLSFYSIITDRELSIEEVMEQYKLRDRVEKSFLSIKTGMRLKSFGTHSDSTTESKVFVCFVASIMRSVLVDKTRKLRQEKKDSKSYTVTAALGELGKIEATESYASGKRVIRYVLSKRQKTILSEFGIDENYLNTKVDSYKEIG